MTASEYWVDLHRAGRRLGGGFLLNRAFVLTALHCLPGLALEDHVDIELCGGERVTGRVRCRDAKADLALVAISEGQQVRLPKLVADRARFGGRWRGPYRPTSTDVHLSGIVSGLTDHPCVGGATIEALQLTVDQHLGDYSGYSGGPVEGVPDDTADSADTPAMLGILIEQTPDRADSTRAANVLIAATIWEAMGRFEQFAVEHLIDVVRPPRSEQRRPPAQTRFSGIEELLLTVDDWLKRGLISPACAAEAQAEAVKRLIEQELGGGDA
ncbi:serine protease [Streptomyces coerulescens]|uniref:Serine protease n=1 Tax=Streptomyces coerulescens TaxID=29304 RepID=A0ABW0CCX6_STRCD